MRRISYLSIVIPICIATFTTSHGMEQIRELIEVPPEVAKKVEPIELVSVTLMPEQKTMVLKFTPGAEGMDFEDVTVVVTFYIQTPNGLKQIDFDPPIDEFKWEAPNAENKLNMLRLASVGKFDQMTVKLHYKDDFKGSWTYKNEEKKEAKQAADLEMQNDLWISNFCAICSPKQMDEKALRELGLENDENIKFYALIPVEIFWGSHEMAKLSLLYHPMVNKFASSEEVLVILHDDGVVLPGEPIRSYIPVNRKKTEASRYRLEGEMMVGRELLVQTLRRYSTEMRKRFPLDKPNVPNKPAHKNP